jgi:spore germination cell wall hydrolase CwlJ-like protein
MDEPTWLALAIFEEAALEPDDGKAAVARVIFNRMRRRYFSDGTIKGTVAWPTQFSFCEFAMLKERYQRVARGPAAIEARCEKLLTEAQAHPKTWAKCREIAGQMLDGDYHGPDYDRLTDDALLYVNLDVVKRPVWAKPDKLVAQIGHHSFFRA